ncbi:MAG TPA: TraR/DksA family transcriptional regulator [Acidimicrobiia bacterium]|nr:TraR/DksA family transcriptional regulator [Acidimicrobiia bacterium]
MSDDDRAGLLEAARDRALTRLGDLSRTFDAIVESSESANLDDEHDPEGSTVGFERAQTSALLDAARTQLAEIDAARDRLRAGLYGRCERCSAAIPAERLQAQPAARLCVTCAARPR